MGNLRDKYTDEEWESIKNNINGRPNIELYLNVSNKEIHTLKKLKQVLSEFYYPHELRFLDSWIEWKTK